jgi:hypothetical protein
MTQISLPSPNIPIGTAKIEIDGQEREVKITLSSEWYQRFLLLVKQLNQNTTDLNP